QAGTLIISSDWEGKTRQVGDQAWLSDQILELPDLNNMEALAEVDEIAAGRLRLGQSVSLRLDAYSEREYSGRVSTIRRVVQKRSADDPTKVMRLIVSIAATDTERMRPGMRFTGVITTDVIADVLSIPRQAVSSDASGAFVILKTAVGHKKVYPDFGQANQQLVAVVSGLQRGDLVLIQNPRVTTASWEE
ncbi:MAG: HlyD family efflux transporter periplasmic adaptor subunit, partial [Thermoanaerobaculia bacterium]